MSFVSFIFMSAFPLGTVVGAGYTAFRSGRFDLSRFGHGTFRSWSFRSRDISVRPWNLAEILYVHFLMQTYLNQRKVLFTKKNQTWSTIQQLINMNVWFSFSSASKLNH